MKALLRFFILLSALLIPLSFLGQGSVGERFPIMLGVTLAVTLGYWIGYAILEKRKKTSTDKGEE